MCLGGEGGGIACPSPAGGCKARQKNDPKLRETPVHSEVYARTLAMYSWSRLAKLVHLFSYISFRLNHHDSRSKE